MKAEGYGLSSCRVTMRVGRDGVSGGGGGPQKTVTIVTTVTGRTKELRSIIPGSSLASRELV